MQLFLLLSLALSLSVPFINSYVFKSNFHRILMINIFNTKEHQLNGHRFPEQFECFRSQNDIIYKRVSNINGLWKCVNGWSKWGTQRTGRQTHSYKHTNISFFSLFLGFFSRVRCVVNIGWHAFSRQLMVFIVSSFVFQIYTYALMVIRFRLDECFVHRRLRLLSTSCFLSNFFDSTVILHEKKQINNLFQPIDMWKD